MTDEEVARFSGLELGKHRPATLKQRGLLWALGRLQERAAHDEKQRPAVQPPAGLSE